MAPDTIHIFVVSDGTGATASAIVKAGLVMFRGVGELAGEVSVTRFPNTRTRRAVDRVLDRAREESAFVVHTFGSNELRRACEAGARERKVPTADVIGPLIESFSKFLKMPAESSVVLSARDAEDVYDILTYGSRIAIAP